VPIQETPILGGQTFVPKFGCEFMFPSLATSSLEANEALEAFHNTLIGPTIDNALRTRFYQDLWAGQVTKGKETDLSKLPFTYKRDIVDAGHSARVVDGQICEELFTSGTTGRPFAYAFNRREQEVLKTFYEDVYQPLSDAPLRRAVRFVDINAAGERIVPVPIRFHNLSIYSLGSFRFCREEILGRQHTERGVEPRCTILCAGERILRAFTDDTVRHYPDGFENPVEAIVTYSVLLTAEIRKRYESIWGARLIDRYALSEVLGGATEHFDCGWYHFDPLVIAEVVGTRSLQPVQEGIGILVLTPLYPFQEAQPLIRYWTGDVMEVTHKKSSFPGRIAIRPLGRAINGLLASEGDDFLMTPNVLHEVVESHPYVERSPLFTDSPQVQNSSELGFPFYKLVTRFQSGITDAKVYFKPRTTASASSVADDIAQRLLDRSPRLADACTSRVVNLSVVPTDKFDIAETLYAH
jgi:hypothetical protein